MTTKVAKTIVRSSKLLTKVKTMITLTKAVDGIHKMVIKLKKTLLSDKLKPAFEKVVSEIVDFANKAL